MFTLLAYGTDQDVFTINQITLALVAYRSAADQDTATASSIAAALLSYDTQVDGLLAASSELWRLGAVRFPDDGRADKVVAAIEEQILVPRTSYCQTGRFAPAAAAVVLATHTAGESAAQEDRVSPQVAGAGLRRARRRRRRAPPGPDAGRQGSTPAFQNRRRRVKHGETTIYKLAFLAEQAYV